MKPEDRLQIAVMDYLRLQYPKVLAIHVANERATSPMQGALLKRKGVTAGVPDVLVFHPKMESGRMEYYGLAIELNVGKNKPTPAQKHMLSEFECAGWQTAVCYNFEAAQYEIDQYLR